MNQRSSHVALLTADLSGGGQARVQANLAGAFARRGHRVDLLFFYSPGPSAHPVPAAVNVVDLRAERGRWRSARFLAADPAAGFRMLLWRALLTRRLFTRPHRSIPAVLRVILRLLAVTRHLRRNRPSVIYAAGDQANMYALCARRLSGSGTRVVISHHNLASAHLSNHTERVGKWRANAALRLMSRAFLQADAIVTCSDGAGDGLSRTARIPRERIAAIYNPVVTPDLPALAKAPLDNPWFRPGAPPVILGAGRLVDQKDFPTLIRAFARVRRQRAARLAILGEGEQRDELEVLAAALGVAEDVALPGFVSNPFAWMSRAGVFALSSKSEGLGNVVIEALACGCPVVGTDCPFGPSEILEGGRFGALVSVGDDAVLAAAIVAPLDDPQPRERLVERGMGFTAERAAERYAQFIPGNEP